MNKKIISKKTISLFEIFILVISIVAFAYFVGDNFRIVKAADISQTPRVSQDPSNYITELTGAKSAVDTVSNLVKPAAPVLTKTLPTTAEQSNLYGSPCIGGGVCGGEMASAPEQTGEEIEAANNAKILGSIVKTAGYIVGNVVIAFGIYEATHYIAIFLGGNPKLYDQLATDLFWGWSIGNSVANVMANFVTTGFLGWLSTPLLEFGGIFTVTPLGLAGLVVGVIVWFFTAKDSKIVEYDFSCEPWQPQKGGKDCDKCNQGQFPCTQYECQSLGQACELLNVGTGNETCAWKDKNDISPPTISAWDGPLNKQLYKYVPDTARLPPDRGVIIQTLNTQDGCIPPFTTFKFGISLDKLGACKISSTRTDSYNNMTTPLSLGYSLYNHTIVSVSGGVNATGTVTTGNGGTYEFFIRCDSMNGYANIGTFDFKYCVSQEKDTTAPSIEMTDPLNGVPISFGQQSINVSVYTDKPSDCRWSHTDISYDSMKTGTMTCAQTSSDFNTNMLYKCSGTLDGLQNSANNNFYFRCKSYPNPQNSNQVPTVMKTSYVYTLIGTQPLVIDSISPNNTIIKGATNSINVTLQAHTSAGYNKGVAICSFKNSSQDDTNYVKFANTGSYAHSQDLYLSAGNYDYIIRCTDFGGNSETLEETFSVKTDITPPVIVRMYNNNNQLDIVTDEQSQCGYDTTDCSYNFADGIKMSTIDELEHLTDWDTTNTFYIKCEDNFGNQPAPDQCSMTVRPSSTTASTISS